MVCPGSTPSLEPHGNLLYVQKAHRVFQEQGQMTLREPLARRLRQQIGLFQSIRSVLFGHLTPPTCCLLV